MNIRNVSSTVRIVTWGAEVTMKGGDDHVIEQLRDGQWVKVWGCNGMSNDYASTETRDRAARLAKADLNTAA
jgi:hypothetical protein